MTQPVVQDGHVLAEHLQAVQLGRLVRVARPVDRVACGDIVRLKGGPVPPAGGRDHGVGEIGHPVGYFGCQRTGVDVFSPGAVQQVIGLSHRRGAGAIAAGEVLTLQGRHAQRRIPHLAG